MSEDHEKPDFGATTGVVIWAKRRITPAVLWTALGALAGAALGLIDAYRDIGNLKTSVVELKQERDLLNKIDTQIAVLTNKIDNIATKVDRQEEWRDKIEGIAEAPPHPRRRQ